MAKRARGESASRPQEGQEECPICYKRLSARTEMHAFQCDHALCNTCHARLIREGDHRCPTCRAPRIGLTRAEAEPHPDRNHEETFGEVLMGMGVEVDPAAFTELVSHSLGAGPYGARPNTGHVMFFPTDNLASLLQQPTPQAPVPRSERQRRSNGPAPPDHLRDMTQAAQAQVRTLEFLNSDAALAAVQALLDVPNVPLAEWHALTGRVAAPAARRRTTRQRSS